MSEFLCRFPPMKDIIFFRKKRFSLPTHDLFLKINLSLFEITLGQVFCLRGQSFSVFLLDHFFFY